LKLLQIIFAMIFSPLAHGDDPCITKYTMMHYAQSRCFDVERPLPDGTTFKIHGGFITKDLSQASTKPTIVLIPGGPGQSSEPLKVALQERELINGMWSPLGMNVVLFDPRGTGFSPLPKATINYDKSVLSSENMVADLKAVVDAISPDKPVFFLAHSAGGHTALRFAELFPNRVSKILLVSASKSAR
jgi:pimeloyl-ACP methyl ester carboxylesterase